MVWYRAGNKKMHGGLVTLIQQVIPVKSQGRIRDGLSTYRR